MKKCFFLVFALFPLLAFPASRENVAELASVKVVANEEKLLLEALSKKHNFEIPQKLAFNEIWGYVVSGYEAALKPAYPISDVAYFGAAVGVKGQLVGVPKRKKLGKYRGRVHLVVADSNRSSTHFALDPSLPMRKKFESDIVVAAEQFDGVQIDFENILAEDRQNFISFLRDLRHRLPESKILSVAVPARTSKLKQDIFDYATIAAVADKVFVMAYDEHWSTSTPGPVASMAWCENIAKYAVKTIPGEKLILGQPLYGRAWTDDDSNGAYRLTSPKAIIDEKSLPVTKRKDGISTISWTVNAKITLFYDDIESLYLRSKMYQARGVKATGFWRLGLEDADIWNVLK